MNCKRCGGTGYATVRWHGMEGVERCDCQSIPAHIDSDRIWHVHPTFGREHVTDQRENCWCSPELDIEDEGAIVIHKVEQ